MRLGVFQAASGGCSFAERLARLDGAIKGHALDLVVCPELFVTGYHITGRHRDLAQSAEGQYFDGIAEVAANRNCAVAYGYPESGGVETFNSAAIVGSNGKLLANHRKRLQSPGSFEETSFENGSTQTWAEIAGIRVTVAICYEIEFPETARAAAKSGAELLIVPTALVEAWPVVAERVVPSRAFENGIWVAYANHGGDELSHRYLGGSRIVAPDGSQPAVAGTEEEMIVADVSAEAVRAAQTRLPYLRDCVKL